MKTVKSLVRHQVTDFKTWKAVFDNIPEVRKAAGELSYEVGTFVEDESIVYLINEWTSVEAFQMLYL